MSYVRTGVLFLALTVAAAAAFPPNTVVVNGQAIASHSRVVSGVTWLPLFPVARALHMKAGWNSHTRKVTLDGHTVATSGRVIGDVVYLPAAAFASAAHARLSLGGLGQVVRLARSGAPAVTAHPVAVVPVRIPPPLPPAPTPTPMLVPVGPDNGNSMPWAQQLPTASNGRFVVPDMPVSTPGGAPNGMVAGWGATPPPPPPVPVATPPAPLTTLPVGPPPPPLTASTAGTAPLLYSPRIAANGVFTVTVTNVQVISSFRTHYEPRSGYHFVTVYVSEQNISDTSQVDSGHFSLVDDSGRSYDAQDDLSNFWQLVLRPQGTNFGYVTFEIPQNSRASKLLLTTSSTPLIAIGL